MRPGLLRSRAGPGRGPGATGSSPGSWWSALRRRRTWDFARSHSPGVSCSAGGPVDGDGVGPACCEGCTRPGGPPARALEADKPAVLVVGGERVPLVELEAGDE